MGAVKGGESEWTAVTPAVVRGSLHTTIQNTIQYWANESVRAPGRSLAGGADEGISASRPAVSTAPTEGVGEDVCVCVVVVVKGRGRGRGAVDKKENCRTSDINIPPPSKSKQEAPGTQVRKEPGSHQETIRK